MRRFHTKRGLNIPLAGAPREEITAATVPEKVALLGPDYHGMRPNFEVEEGADVRLGQTLFTDKKRPGVKFTAPASGKLIEINRGAKRALLSVVLEVTSGDPRSFEMFATAQLESLGTERVTQHLIDTGLWTALRTRPFSRTPAVDSRPDCLFVTATDTEPHAPDPAPLIHRRADDFVAGLKVLSNICGQTLYVCKGPAANIPGGDMAKAEVVEFSGPHPAGLPGTHIHFLAPAGRQRMAWHIGYQDVMAIGATFVEGRLDVRRVISLAGPRAANPRLIETQLGAAIDGLVRGEIDDSDKPARVVSGSVLNGHTATGPLAYLGRFHRQVTLLTDEAPRQFFGWFDLGFGKFSMKNVLPARWIKSGPLDLNTAKWGGRRAIFPAGSYEDVTPLDIIPTFLFRALAIEDIEQAEQLGALELDEEDLALATFVSPAKLEYGPMLRRNLDIIEKEG